MTDELYDKYRGIWWNSSSIPMYEINGEIYALDGWNGETYLHCWKCSGENLTEASEEEYAISPIYDEDDNITGYEVF